MVLQSGRNLEFAIEGVPAQQFMSIVQFSTGLPGRMKSESDVVGVRRGMHRAADKLAAVVPSHKEVMTGQVLL